jgi:hypothetical protein
MPRLPRSFQSGLVYHVINRGNGQPEVFHKPQDYADTEVRKSAEEKGTGNFSKDKK